MEGSDKNVNARKKFLSSTFYVNRIQRGECMNRKSVSYIGVFTKHIDGKLDKDIPNQHITLAFQPDEEQFKELLPLLGQDCAYKIIGYGNDGKNEGLHVVLEPGIPYFGAEQQHITLSVSLDGKPVDTGALKFDEHIPMNVDVQDGAIFIGQIGAFTRDRVVVYDKTKFEEFNHVVDTVRDTAAKICISANMKPMISQSKDSAELSYRIDGEPWKVMGKNDANLLGTFNNVDVMIKDEHSTVIIEGAMLFQMDDALIIAGDIDGQGVCWSNVDFTDEYEKQRDMTVIEKDITISDAAERQDVGEDGIEVDVDGIERE